MKKRVSILILVIFSVIVFNQVDFVCPDWNPLAQPVDRIVVEASLLAYTLVVHFGHRLANHLHQP